MKYASIDIGTNTLRLLIAESDCNGHLKPFIYKRAITRLGGGYTDGAGIDPASAQRTFAAIEGFRKVMMEAGVEDVTAVATSVVRRACNRGWFLREVFNRTGINVDVISGDEEARLSLAGVLSVIDGKKAGKRLVIDIGGGSTEFIATSGEELTGAWSMEMGVVHLSERHLKSDPPDKKDLDALEGEISGVIAALKGLMKNDKTDPEKYSGEKGAALVGTAGTITTLAAIDQGLEVYDRERINNYTLSKPKVRNIYDYLCGLTLRERGHVLTLEKGREDLIIPGAAITLTVMEAFGFNEIKVSDAGLLEGVIIKKVASCECRSGCKNNECVAP